MTLPASAHAPPPLPPPNFQWRHQAQLCIIFVLVVVTLIFEWTKEYIEERFHSYRPVLERIWGELTVLGFLALCTFVMIQSEVLQYFSKMAFGDEEHMVCGSPSFPLNALGHQQGFAGTDRVLPFSYIRCTCLKRFTSRSSLCSSFS